MLSEALLKVAAKGEPNGLGSRIRMEAKRSASVNVWTTSPLEAQPTYVCPVLGRDTGPYDPA